MMNFKAVKKILLEDENIYNVELTEEGMLEITPNQAKSYFYTQEPIEKYMQNNNIVKINGTSFSIVNIEWFNTSIYKIILEELNSSRIDLDIIVEKLKEEYLEKEITLLKLDNAISVLENKSKMLFVNNIFDYDVREMLNTSFTYLEVKDSLYNFESGINFEFEIIEDNEEEINIFLKVINIEVI